MVDESVFCRKLDDTLTCLDNAMGSCADKTQILRQLRFDKSIIQNRCPALQARLQCWADGFGDDDDGATPCDLHSITTGCESQFPKIPVPRSVFEHSDTCENVTDTMALIAPCVEQGFQAAGCAVGRLSKLQLLYNDISTRLSDLNCGPVGVALTLPVGYGVPEPRECDVLPVCDIYAAVDCLDMFDATIADGDGCGNWAATFDCITGYLVDCNGIEFYSVLLPVHKYFGELNLQENGIPVYCAEKSDWYSTDTITIDYISLMEEKLKQLPSVLEPGSEKSVCDLFIDLFGHEFPTTEGLFNFMPGFKRLFEQMGGFLEDYCTNSPAQLKCYNCHKANSHQECNAQDVQINRMSCMHLGSYAKVQGHLLGQPGAEMCQTIVKDGKNGITKKCVKKESCHERCNGNGNRCEYCCDETLCNIGIEQTCDTSGAAVCLFDYFMSAMAGLALSQDGQTQLCDRFVGETACITQELQDTCPAAVVQKLAQTYILSQQVVIVSGICAPVGPICSAPSADNCLSQLGQQVARFDHINGDKEEICRARQHARYCLELALSACDEKMRSRILVVFRELECLATDICPPDDDVDPPMEPDACVDPALVSDDAACYPLDALSCSAEFIMGKALNPFIDPSHICLAYSKALHCLLENLHDCHFLGEEATRTALIGVTKIARHYGCTTDMRSPCDEELCAEETMNACYRLLDINNTETLDEICMQLDRVDACTHAAVEFCTDSVKLSRSVRLSVERKEYNCPVPPSYPECQEHIATECIIVYEQQIVNLPQVAKCVMYTSVTACILEAMSMCVKEDEGHEVSIGVIDEAKKKLLNVLGSCRTLPKFQFSNTDHKILLEEGQPGQSVCFSLAQDIGEVCSDGHCAVQLKYELIEDRSNVLYCSKHNEISQVLVSGSCGLIFTVENWNEDQCFVLTPTMDRKKDGDHTAMFKLNAELIVNGQMVMSSQVREYQLTVVDRDTVSQCSASNGHITTFDGYTYAYMYYGEYKLYGHVGGPYQVWATSSECSEGNTHGSCICEAGVKCGDDMFVINHCYKEKKDKMKPTLWQNHELTSGCRIYRGRGGRSYRVELPHGTSVEIKIEKKDKKKDKKARLLDYLKIVINPSTADLLNTEGLCGTYDGNLLNDLTALNGDVYNPADIPVFKCSPKKKLKPRPDAFSRSWRTEFITDYHLVGVSPNPFDPVLLKFCRPGGDTCVCSDRSTPVNYCELNRKGKWQDVTNSLSIKSKVKSNRKSRRKRQTSTDFTDLLVDSNFVPELPTFPTSNGITFEMANETCYDALTGAAFHNICSNVILEDQQLQLLKDKLDNCVSDILENEGATWYVKSSVDDYRDKCMLFAESSPDYTIIVDLDSFTCDNDCSGHGACVNDVCICTADYGSYDCSINVNDAPTVDSLDGTMCEPTVNDTCDLVTVYGDNFIENGNVSCHIEVVQVSDNGITKSGNNFTVPATFENYNMITCDISQAGSQLLTAVLISASNNGLVTNASAQHLFIVYDSVCWECNVDQQDGNCQRNGGCVVDDVCYASLAPSPSDACLLCDAWNDTLRYSESCPSTTTADGVTTKGATTAGATTTGVTTAGATTAGATTADATTTEPSARTGSSSTNDATVIGVAAGVAGFILLLIAILACFFVMRQRKQIERRYASKREYSDRRSGESPEIVPGYVNEVYTVYPDYFETPDAVFAGSMPKRHSSRQPDGTTQYNNQHDAKNPRASHT